MAREAPWRWAAHLLGLQAEGLLRAPRRLSAAGGRQVEVFCQPGGAIGRKHFSCNWLQA